MIESGQRRVAVVGSGVAGLTAAWIASRTAHVTLYEADDRLGGHADTHRVSTPEGELAIDTGFIVHNRRTYPTLLRLFAELGVETQPSEMSLSVSDAGTGVEYAGALGAKGLFAQRSSLASRDHWRMLLEIPRFHRRARALLATSSDDGGGDGDDQTLREFLRDGGFTPGFVRHFMEPLVAAVWSCDPSTSLDYPARYLFTFLEHHGMLGVFGSPEWRTVSGGSVQYVAKVGAGLQEVRLDTKVTSVRELADRVEVTDGSGATTAYDALVIATHPSHALAMLEEPTDLQREVLSALPYSHNPALLHTDTSLLPSAEGARASWNFFRPADDNGAVTVTYDLTRLQRLPTDTHYLVTLGGEDLVDPAKIIDRMDYEHPLYTPESVAASRRLPEINTDRIAFAGAYHGWGFHEDGARSGLVAATHLDLPWVRTTHAVPQPGRFETVIRHTRRTPFRRTFEHRSTFWLVDVDDLPSHGVLASFEARDHLGSPDRSLRHNVEAFLDRHDVSLGTGGGTILMAAQPRSLGYAFNPISVFWCFDDDGAQAAVVVEVHNTYGDRHAYLVHPDEQGRAQTDKAMYVSPFHGTDGAYDVAVPIPTDRLHVAVTLRGHDNGGSAPFSASLTGTRSDVPVRRTLGAALRGSALIRAHGIWLWARRLPIRPRPTHSQEGVK
ncbi:Predicted NAD/FAD-binding protein [Nocardioides exalbidus]|uniref:Predicted NAD/FAD-binding protein n=1 Tax=Nocardioides exalbidus TaxID=402596 RepID=A0A1H4MW04_9ACTN|nr:FAD-dependent oxidoreductase [Nocardioides exalbidus]SEB86934.1 Predicted NAD/FAD-binding protein [Nocardioides exalbidus]